MSHILMRASGKVSPTDFIHFSTTPALHFTLDAVSDMQHNNYSPYQPNPLTSDDAYLYPSPNPEEQSAQSYASLPQYHASQFPSQSLPNGGRYYPGLDPHQLRSQGLGRGGGIQQQFETHGSNMPRDMPNVHESSAGYSAYPYRTQFPPATHPYQMGGHSSHIAPAGPVDPNGGMFFYPSTEGPRLRTAQACQKCRARKAKCSGDHPSCERCLTRGLVCEYAAEGRTRGPNKPKITVDPGSSPGNSPTSGHYGFDPVSGAGPSGRGHSEQNQFANTSAEYVRGHSAYGHILDTSYAASPMMHGSEGSMSGSSAGTPSSARSTPLTSPGVNSPLFGSEMSVDPRQRNAASWFAHPAFDGNYDQLERHPSR